MTRVGVGVVSKCGETCIAVLDLETKLPEPHDCNVQQSALPIWGLGCLGCLLCISLWPKSGFGGQDALGQPSSSKVTMRSGLEVWTLHRCTLLQRGGLTAGWTAAQRREVSMWQLFNTKGARWQCDNCQGSYACTVADQQLLNRARAHTVV